jgi:hypothetical protein
MRNKDFFMCPVGALGFYMVERFHIDLEPFPDFSVPELVQYKGIFSINQSYSNLEMISTNHWLTLPI